MSTGQILSLALIVIGLCWLGRKLLSMRQQQRDAADRARTVSVAPPSSPVFAVPAGTHLRFRQPGRTDRRRRGLAAGRRRGA